MKTSTALLKKNKDILLGSLLILLLLIAGILGKKGGFSDSWSNFATVFLGIFIEAIPFLLMGTLASGLVEIFISPEFLQKIKPNSTLLATLAGCFLGLIFPVCECGVVPLVRRLYQKGLPISTGIAFLLAAPVINPIVIFSTASAFGFGRMLWMRIGFTIVIALITGMVFSTATSRSDVLQANTSIVCACHGHDHSGSEATGKGMSFLGKMEYLLEIATDELFEMGRYLIFGSLLSAAMQTFIPQSMLLKVGGGAILSVLVMIALAVLLSICSTVDSFVALSFVGSFTTASVLAFLLYGPMVDIKSILMFTHVFKKRSVLYLFLIPLVLTILICVTMNYFWVS